MKAALQNAAVFPVAAIALVGIEICLRVWGPEVLALGNVYVFYEFDPVLGWNNLPNAHGRLDNPEYSIEVSNNSLGMRDVEIGDYEPYNHPKSYAKLSSDGTRVDIAGYPLPVSTEQGPALAGAASSLRIVGLVNLAMHSLTKPRGGEVVYALPFHAPPEQWTPAKRDAIASIYKINELLLEQMRERVDRTVGPDRFAVLLVPTKIEYAPPKPGFDPNAVGDGVLANLQRLNIPAIDGRPVITPADFWEHDSHWRPSGHRKIGELIAAYLASVPRPPGAASAAIEGRMPAAGSGDAPAVAR